MDESERIIPKLGVRARWGTHIPAMVLAVELFPGRVLELGIGCFSTAILHNLSPKYLLSVESNPGWIRRFVALRCESHAFRHVVDYDKLFETIGLDWDVVLVDHAPFRQRFKDLARLKGHSKIFVVHDTEKGPVERRMMKEESMTEKEVKGIGDLLASFKYRIDFKHIAPYTSILSDDIDIGKLILDGLLMKGK